MYAELGVLSPYSNTTNVKVKLYNKLYIKKKGLNSNTTNVKVKLPFAEALAALLQIQIQPMLRLNLMMYIIMIMLLSIQIQPMLRLN